ncbi:MAG: division/cell wall cluster transcriptional repressor MraZ [Bacteroidota bacterium]
MTNIIGTYNCKADAKGRVALPASLKSQLAPMINDGFVIKHSMFLDCLELHPLQEYNAMMMKIKRKGGFNRKYVKVLRRFVSGAQPVNIDDSGRLQIPKDLVGFAGITKEVVLTATIDVIEIWDKDKYNADLKEGEEDYPDLLEEVLDGDGNDESIS